MVVDRMVKNPTLASRFSFSRFHRRGNCALIDLAPSGATTILRIIALLLVFIEIPMCLKVSNRLAPWQRAEEKESGLTVKAE